MIPVASLLGPQHSVVRTRKQGVVGRVVACSGGVGWRVGDVVEGGGVCSPLRVYSAQYFDDACGHALPNDTEVLMTETLYDVKPQASMHTQAFQHQDFKQVIM